MAVAKCQLHQTMTLQSRISGQLILGALTQRIAKGAGGKGPRQKTSKIVKNRQKSSKSFSTLFDNFRAGQKRQKSSKSVKYIFDSFRAAPVFWPLLGGSD